EVDGVTALQQLCDADCHLLPQLGQQVAREPAVEDPPGVVDLAVADHVHEGAATWGHGPDCPMQRPSDELAPVCSQPPPRERSQPMSSTAPGRADRIASTASSSMAAETNQVSNALGGRCTPRRSMPWKNRPNAAVSWSWAPA